MSSEINDTNSNEREGSVELTGENENEENEETQQDREIEEEYENLEDDLESHLRSKCCNRLICGILTDFSYF